MVVSYDVFTAAFLNKITEYRFQSMSASCRQSMVDMYMKLSCSRFSEVCKRGIDNGDDESRTFNLSIDTESDKIEIIDIVSEGMLVYFLKPYLYSQKNLELLVETADHTFHSQAELFRRINDVYMECASDFERRLISYSYRHGDLSDLHKA